MNPHSTGAKVLSQTVTCVLGLAWESSEEYGTLATKCLKMLTLESFSGLCFTQRQCLHLLIRQSSLEW